ncbi:MAG TPA: metal ABC transporter ATP-binding protein [Candidatus Paceibacterota bacterium]
MEDVILSVKNLSVFFGEEAILKNLSFEVKRGETAAIIGPNGAGKTVLFKSLIGSVPRHGEVSWAPGTKIGYVPQKLDLDRHLSLTLGDFLLLKVKLMKLDKSEVRRVLEQVHLLSAKLKIRLTYLSGGDFQRSLIAFALIGKPNVLLFDEPTSGIDLPGEEQIYQTVHKLQDQYRLTVIIISHDLNLVYRYADTVLCLNRKLFCVGNPEETLKPDVLDRLYGSAMMHHLHVHERA